jgi:hypothetical protein
MTVHLHKAPLINLMVQMRNGISVYQLQQRRASLPRQLC